MVGDMIICLRLELSGRDFSVNGTDWGTRMLPPPIWSPTKNTQPILICVLISAYLKFGAIEVMHDLVLCSCFKAKTWIPIKIHRTIARSVHRRNMVSQTADQSYGAKFEIWPSKINLTFISHNYISLIFHQIRSIYFVKLKQYDQRLC